jgi:hypothetical protein
MSDIEYEPIEGNPNLIGAKAKKKPKIITEDAVLEVESFIIPFVYRALTPFYQFVGFLEAESGKKLYYRYDKNASLEEKQNPIVKGSKTFEEFKAKNAHLGQAFFWIFRDQLKVKEEKGIGISIQHQELYKEIVDSQATVLQMERLPHRLWSILPTSAFTFLIGAATFGAIEMCANELKKDFKLLIVSPDVNYMFAQFVSRKFISPKSNAFASGIDGQGGAQYRISSGFGTSSMANSKWLLACKIWFETVYEVDNPAAEPEAAAQAIYALVNQLRKWTTLDDDETDRFLLTRTLEQQEAFLTAKSEYIARINLPKVYVRSLAKQNYKGIFN